MLVEQACCDTKALAQLFQFLKITFDEAITISDDIWIYGDVRPDLARYGHKDDLWNDVVINKLASFKSLSAT